MTTKDPMKHIIPALVALCMLACSEPKEDVDLTVSADGAETEPDTEPSDAQGADADEMNGISVAEFLELQAEVAELRAARTFSAFSFDHNSSDLRLDVSGALEMEPLTSVSFQAPAAGNAIVNANVSFGYGEAANIVCSLAKDATFHEDGTRVYAQTIGPADLVSASATRGFALDPGERATFNLLCNASGVVDADSPEWHDAQLTVVFSPAP